MRRCRRPPGPCRGHAGAMLGPCWGHAGAMLGPCWGHAGDMLGPCRGHAGYMQGTCWFCSQAALQLCSESLPRPWRAAGVHILQPLSTGGLLARCSHVYVHPRQLCARCAVAVAAPGLGPPFPAHRYGCRPMKVLSTRRAASTEATCSPGFRILNPRGPQGATWNTGCVNARVLRAWAPPWQPFSSGMTSSRRLPVRSGRHGSARNIPIMSCPRRNIPIISCPFRGCHTLSCPVPPWPASPRARELEDAERLGLVAAFLMGVSCGVRSRLPSSGHPPLHSRAFAFMRGRPSGSCCSACGPVGFQPRHRCPRLRLSCACPPLCVGVQWQLFAWVWQDARSGLPPPRTLGCAGLCWAVLASCSSYHRSQCYSPRLGFNHLLSNLILACMQDSGLGAPA